MLSRRQFLALAGAGGTGLALSGCGGPGRSAALVMPDDPVVAATEARRRASGARVVDLVLAAAPGPVDLGGLTVDTWTYNGSLPGQELRVRAGDVIRARLDNGLPEATTVHWHGISLRNDMDGVPGVTQHAVAPGAQFTYEFTAPDPGTYWFHPHTGMHADTGLYAPLIVEDPSEPGAYDREYTIVLDDWTHGLSASPDEELAKLQRGEGGHAAHAAAAGGGSGTAAVMTGGPYLGGAHPGDVLYPLYLVNGRRASAPVTFEASPGQRVRFRIVNSAADTPFRFAIGGHHMLVTHADGFPVKPVRVEALMVAMAERYDVVVTVGSGVFPIVAVAEEKGDAAFAVLRAGLGSAPPASARPAELDGKVLQLDHLRAAQQVRLPEGRPRRTFALELGEGEGNYVWTINGRVHGEDEALRVEQGEKVRLALSNRSPMFHPMHLHGHTFQVVTSDGGAGARKDTAIVRPDHRLAVDFVADNPGQWMLHCHNIYHQQSGMMTSIAYMSGDPADVKGGLNGQAAGGWRLVCDYLGRPVTVA